MLSFEELFSNSYKRNKWCYDVQQKAENHLFVMEEGEINYKRR